MVDLTCPWCGEHASPEEARFISESPAGVSDPVLGRGMPLRFKPTRFDAGARALDPDGRPACTPACHACRRAWPGNWWSATRRGVIAIAAADPKNIAAWMAAAAAQRVQAIGGVLTDVTPNLPPLPAWSSACLQLRDRGGEVGIVCLVPETEACHGDVILLDEASTLPPQSKAITIRLTADQSGLPVSVLLRSGGIALDRLTSAPDGAYHMPKQPETAIAAVLAALGMARERAVDA